MAFLVFILFVIVFWLMIIIIDVSQHHYEQEMALHRRIKALEDKTK